VVLEGLATLLQQNAKWDFVIHLSESDYPLHTGGWLRKFLGNHRQSNFIQLEPRCTRLAENENEIVSSDWYWWKKNRAVASCGDKAVASEVGDVTFPLIEMERRGFRFARGPEWVILTRELVDYALSPGISNFKRLVGAHMGADEMFWQTLVLNIPNFTQRVQSHGWFIRWGHGKTQHSPDTLNLSYIDELVMRNQTNLFMRKVDANESASLLNHVDQLPEPDFDQPIDSIVDLQWTGSASTYSSRIQLGDDEAWDKHAVACPGVDSEIAFKQIPQVHHKETEGFDVYPRISPHADEAASVAAHFKEWDSDDGKEAGLISSKWMEGWW
jgi:hypothetical protein